MIFNIGVKISTKIGKVCFPEQFVSQTKYEYEYGNKYCAKWAPNFSIVHCFDIFIWNSFNRFAIEVAAKT